MRIALDTNVLVSAIATRGLCADIFTLLLAEHRLVVGVTVLDESKRVLREKIGVPKQTILEFDTLLRQESVVVGRSEPLSVPIRDHSDVPVLAEAVAGGADVLVTGDRDLLEIKESVTIRILDPRGMWELLRDDTPP